MSRGRLSPHRCWAWELETVTIYSGVFSACRSACHFIGVCTTMVITENGLKLIWFAMGGEIGYHDLAGLFRGAVRDLKTEMAEIFDFIE